ncbi:hypothetical protein ACHAXR_012255 [Thalassiosira sp. AJA248-18]
MTKRLSAMALAGQSLEELVILPTITRQMDDHTKKTLQNNTQSPVVVYQRGGNLTKIHRYFPRTISIDNPDLFKSTQKRKRRIYVDRHALRAWKLIEDDENYPTIQNETASHEECILMSSWQTDSYPSCNSIHEQDVYSKARNDDFYYVASGGYNDVFRIYDRGNATTGLNPELALKILSPGKKHRAGIPHKTEYSQSNFDIVRQDALVLERLTRSSNVLPLYGYCGFSVAVPYADGGTLGSILTSEWSRGKKGWKNNITSATRLKYAAEAAKGLADIHDIGVVHADLTIKQYLVRDGTLQLGDFNRGIYMRRNSTAPETACTFQMTNNYGTTRAPEEYLHKLQTSAVDVWSLGSILYQLLTGGKVWGKTKKKEAQEAVIQGIHPEIHHTILNSSDPVDKILKKALDMCYIYEPSQRATAREVASLLRKGVEELTT